MTEGKLRLREESDMPKPQQLVNSRAGIPPQGSAPQHNALSIKVQFLFLVFIEQIQEKEGEIIAFRVCRNLDKAKMVLTPEVGLLPALMF